MTPDSLYGALLKNATFESYESRVVKGIEQLGAELFDFVADTFLVFVDHFEASALADLFYFVRRKFPNAVVFIIENFQTPIVSLIWPSTLERQDRRTSHSIEELNLVLQELSAGIVEESIEDTFPTESQLSILQAVASGMSNEEIASSRNTSRRAVEALINRSMKRIGIGELSNSRQNLILVQRYLHSIGLGEPKRH